MHTTEIIKLSCDRGVNPKFLNESENYMLVTERESQVHPYELWHDKETNYGVEGQIHGQ